MEKKSKINCFYQSECTVRTVLALCTGIKGTVYVYLSDILIIVYRVAYLIIKGTLLWDRPAM